MSKILLGILTLFIISCKDFKDPIIYKLDIKKYVVDMKYCISECRTATFATFHNEGDSWGTGSSSMNGLQEHSVLSKVDKLCKEFYYESTCCKTNSNERYDSERWVNNFKSSSKNYHSRYYGECNE